MMTLTHVVQVFMCAAVALTSWTLAFADVQTIVGRKMKVEDPLPGVNPSKRVVTVHAYERLTPNTIVGNPITGGATVQVPVTGATSTRQTFNLPAGPPPQSTGPGWTGKIVPGRGAKFLYVDKNGEASPVTKLALLSTIGRRFVIKVKIEAQGNNAPVDIVPGNPSDELGIAVTIGSGDANTRDASRGSQVVKLGRARSTGEPTPTLTLESTVDRQIKMRDVAHAVPASWLDRRAG